MSLWKEPDAVMTPAADSGFSTDTNEPPKSTWRRSRWTDWLTAWVVVLTGMGFVIAVMSWMQSRVVSPELIAARQLIWKLSEETDAKRRADAAQSAEMRLIGVNQGKGPPNADQETSRVLMAAVRLEREEKRRSSQRFAWNDTSRCSPDDVALSALIFAQNREFESADRLLTAAMKTEPRTIAMLRAAARCNYEMGRGDEVLSVCQEWSRCDAVDPEPYRWILQVQEDRGLIHLTANACRHLLDRSINDRVAIQQKEINLLIRMGSSAEAREQFERANHDQPQANSVESSAAREWRLMEVRLLHLEGVLPRARELLEEVLFVEPQNAEALLLKGRILLSASEVAEAVAILEQVVALRPTDGDSHYLLGQAYARQQRREQAQTHLKLHRQLRKEAGRINSLERLAKRRPDDVQVRRSLMALFLELGLHDQAEQWEAAIKSIEQRTEATSMPPSDPK